MPGDGDQFGLHAQSGSQFVGYFGVIAFNLHAGVQRGEGREILKDADFQHASFGHVFQRIGKGRGKSPCEQYGGKRKAGAAGKGIGHVSLLKVGIGWQAFVLLVLASVTLVWGMVQ